MACAGITEATVSWVEGFIGVIAILALILGFWVNLRKAKYSAETAQVTAQAEADKSKREAVDKAVAEAKKETESAIEFRSLKKAVEDMTVAVKCITDNTTREFQTIRETDHQRVKWITEIEASTKSAHKRIDEHRSVEHGVKNGSRTHMAEVEDAV